MASNEGRGWEREIEALNLDLHVFKAEDGSQRRKVVKNAGWPSWADENTVYFHRVADDGWWSIFRVNVSDSSAEQGLPPSFPFVSLLYSRGERLSDLVGAGI